MKMSGVKFREAAFLIYWPHVALLYQLWQLIKIMPGVYHEGIR